MGELDCSPFGAGVLAVYGCIGREICALCLLVGEDADNVFWAVCMYLGGQQRSHLGSLVWSPRAFGSAFFFPFEVFLSCGEEGSSFGAKEGLVGRGVAVGWLAGCRFRGEGAVKYSTPRRQAKQANKQE